MTQPVYAPTAGPADPNAGVRAKLYSGLALITPLLSFLATFNIFTSVQVNAVTGALTAVMGVLSAFGFGLAATKTHTQVKNGTFEPAPPPPPVDAKTTALDSLTHLKNEVNSAVEEAQARALDGITAIQVAAASIPGVGAVVTPIGDLLRSVTQDVNPAQ